MEEGPRILLLALLSLWLFIWGYSFAALILTEPVGTGFLAGFNRVTTFLGWQLFAALPALAAWGVGRKWPKGSGVRIVSRIPVQLALGLAAIGTGLILWARFVVG